MTGKTGRSVFLLLACLWVAAVLWVDPRGDFPLNDDWMFAKPIHSFLEGRGFQVSDQATVTFILHSLSGLAVCTVTGFSFTALRILTLAFGLMALWAFTRLLDEEGAPPRRVFLAGLLLLVNPLFVSQSFTFMTDVPFLALALWAIVFYRRTLSTLTPRPLLFATAFSTAALLVRQVAIVLPVAFVLSLLSTRDSRRFPKPAMAAALLVPLATLMLYPSFMDRMFRLPAWYNAQGQRFLFILQDIPSWHLIGMNLWIQGTVALAYLGLFTLPILIPWVLASGASQGRVTISRFMAGCLPVSGLYFAMMAVLSGRNMPYTGNIIFDGGIGPVMLRDTSILNLPHFTPLPAWIWVLVTVLTVLGATLLLSALSGLCLRSGSEPHKTRWLLFLGACLAGYFFPILTLGLYDRYLLFALPLILCLFTGVAPSPSPGGWRGIAGFGSTLLFLLALGYFSFAGTHDLLSWNRARWHASDLLLEKNRVVPSMIDGGFEWNGWHTYRFPNPPVPGKSWWWVEGDDYVLTLGPLDGYAMQARIPFKKRLPPGREHLWILKKMDASTPDRIFVDPGPIND